MSSVFTLARGLRADVLRGDRAMLRQLSGAYDQIEKRLKRDLDALSRDITAAQKQGMMVNQDWLRKSARYQSLVRNTKSELQGYARGAAGFIEAKQRQAIGLGQSHAAQLIQTATDKPFVRLPGNLDLAGTLGDGTSLSKKLERLSTQTATRIRKSLLDGVRAGNSPAKLKSEAGKAVEWPRWKTLQTARTETLRAYRTSTLQTYAENGDVLNGWVWVSARSKTTCLVCWSLSGQFFPLTKTFFPAHISCACTSVPSFKNVRVREPLGTDQFDQLSVAEQKFILGPTRYELYQAGTPLRDFVMQKRSKDYGVTYGVRSLKSFGKRQEKLDKLRTALQSAGERAKAVKNRKTRRAA